MSLPIKLSDWQKPSNSDYLELERKRKKVYFWPKQTVLKRRLFWAKTV